MQYNKEMQRLKYMSYPNPKISVIVITYNQEKTIGRTLDSILCQKCGCGFEIVIGEDCSTDRTREICIDYARRFPGKINLILNNHNKGLLDNYFDCILAAKGDYIADCAGDDFWIDDLKLEKQRKILDRNPAIAMVHSAWNYYDISTGRVYPSEVNGCRFHKPIAEKGELILPLLRRDAAPIVHLCTALYRRDVFMKIYHEDTRLFRNKEFTCEDLQIATTFSASGKIAWIPDITLNYSVGEATISSEENNLKTFDFYVGSTKLTRYLQLKYNVSDDDMNRYYRNIFQFLIANSFNGHDRARIKTAIELAGHYGIELTTKAKILDMLSRNPIVFKLAHKLKNSLR